MISRHGQSLFFTPIRRAALAAVLMGGATSAFAGSGEAKALAQAAGLGTNTALLSSLSSSELLTAFQTVIATPKYSTAKEVAIVAGEALKAAGPSATNAGTVFATAITNPANSTTFAAITPNLSGFAALAAKTSGTGKGANELQIPDLTAGLFASLGAGSDAAVMSAAIASKSKQGAGAILGGGAIIDGTDQKATDLANGALLVKTLAGSAQYIAQYIAAEVNDSAAFAVNVAQGSDPLKFKFAISVAVGAAAGDSTNAGNILHSLLGEKILLPNGTLGDPTVTSVQAGLIQKLDKSITSVAKSMSAVADIEEVQKMGNAIGQQIASGAVKLSVANGIAKTLVSAVMNKPEIDVFGNVINRNGDSNKADEIAEVAAYLVSGFLGSPDLNVKLIGTAKKDATAAKDLLAIITTAVKVKPNKKIGGPLPDTFAADVAGSVALTVLNAPTGTGLGQIPQEIKDAFKALMQDPNTAKKIDKNVIGTIQSVIAGVYNGDAGTIHSLEDGNSVAGAVSDPETDLHPFS